MYLLSVSFQDQDVKKLDLQLKFIIIISTSASLRSNWHFSVVVSSGSHIKLSSGVGSALRLCVFIVRCLLGEYTSIRIVRTQQLPTRVSSLLRWVLLQWYIMMLSDIQYSTTSYWLPLTFFYLFVSLQWKHHILYEYLSFSKKSVYGTISLQ